ncbi:MAG: hypothetical protein ACPL6D_11380, partial [Thermodesulfobacteriota bacterium]
MEEAGFSTVVLTPTHEFNRLVGVPRSAAIEYPYGRPVGQVGDREGQRKVLLEALSVLEKANAPGQVHHLPFIWPEEPKNTDWQPPEMSPIVKLQLDEIRKFRQGV